MSISPKDYYREVRVVKGKISQSCIVTGCPCDDVDCRMCAFAATAFSRGRKPVDASDRMSLQEVFSDDQDR